jgi:predicted neuraminidase
MEIMIDNFKLFRNYYIFIIGIFLSVNICLANVKPLNEDNNSVERTLVLNVNESNPRNSEGDFIQLNNGRLMFIYSHFTEGGSDHSSAHLAARYSDDFGESWSNADELILANQAGMNIMSVSLLRLNNGHIGLFYLRKNSLEDCRPVLRISTDEGQSWSEPIDIIPDREIGYYILNNDRVIQLQSGRLIVPVAQHNAPQRKEWSAYGHIMCYLSDDNGRTWHRSTTVLSPTYTESGDTIMMQEPGVVELSDGRILMWTRTDKGSQYISFSTSAGKTWTAVKPGSLTSPRAPASLKRIPQTGDLLYIWNDNYKPFEGHKGKRTPLSLAISENEGQTWNKVMDIENHPNTDFHYTAITFVTNWVVVAYGINSELQISRIPLNFIY